MKKILAPMADSYHKRYNPTWGQLFKAGYQDSRFSFYVNNVVIDRDQAHHPEADAHCKYKRKHHATRKRKILHFYS